ncbi:hypothetical protein HB13667_17210 [Pseudomonas putida]|uniref:Uncharacterized protein n=1 Tax=Pseudomonas putida TaxID=303 RepID=A0A0P7C8Z7_PSEPU|nr:hypothetical protein HB13667_17210 [Pseudomonas putida]
MTAWILVIHWVALAVGIRVQTTLIERTQAVRAVEPHQRGNECSITITQVVMLGDWVQLFTVEAEYTLIRQMVAIGRIRIFCVHQAGSSTW